MSSYNIAIISACLVSGVEATVLRIGFGTPAQNTEIVREASAKLATMEMAGPLVLLNGPASLPVAIVLAHRLVHLFGALGVFDPKLNGYVISATHDPRFDLGQLIPATEVQEG